MSSARFVRGFGLGLGLDLAVILAVGAAPGFAQSTVSPTAASPTVPTREGNVWDHRDHQPTAATAGAEQRAGIAPSAQRAQREDEELARINKQLLQPNGGKTPP